MVEKNLPSLKIHKLTQAQYDMVAAQGELEDDSIYLVDDEVVLTTEITEETSHEEIPSAKAVYDLCTKLIQEALNK